MMDHSDPVTEQDGKLTFNLENPEDRFYFEGGTETTKEELPWNILVSYRLNGLEKRRKNSAAAGLVEVKCKI